LGTSKQKKKEEIIFKTCGDFNKKFINSLSINQFLTYSPKNLGKQPFTKVIVNIYKPLLSGLSSGNGN